MADMWRTFISFCPRTAHWLSKINHRQNSWQYLSTVTEERKLWQTIDQSLNMDTESKLIFYWFFEINWNKLSHIKLERSPKTFLISFNRSLNFNFIKIVILINWNFIPFHFFFRLSCHNFVLLRQMKSSRRTGW